MKNTLKYSVLAAICVIMSVFTGCAPASLDTDQFADTGITLAAVQPNPVMRGGVLNIVGSNLQDVTEVRFAGGVTVTDIEKISSGRKSEIRVKVPLEGPEVGPVTIVGRDGKTFSTIADLTYTEAIEVTSITPATAWSGDEITIKGEYLNIVQEIILGGDIYVTEFSAQSRHELKFVLPSNALTGYVILGDVNEVIDENTIPNKVYSPEELVVGDPTVVKAEKAVYKAGDLITVKGAHLDMIERVNLPGAGSVDYMLAEDGSSIRFELPYTANDGEMVLVSFAGKEFSAGEIETVTVSDVAIAPLAEDGRYKAGTQVEITGEDLDLVSKVEFVNAEASWYLSDGKIIADIPAAAQDGPVTLLLASGKKAYSDEIEVVKPEIIAWEGPKTIVAGKSEMDIIGTDLDLVTSVKMGIKAEGFVECTFVVEEIPEISTYKLTLKVPRDAYTSPITLTSAAGYEDATDDSIEITYDEAISITFTESEVGLGRPIMITGENLLKIDQIYIKGKRVVDYGLRNDDAMSFAIPEGIGPGVYRLQIFLMDGTELVWPVAFSISAPYTEDFVWRGFHDLAGWGANLEAGPEDGFVQVGLQVGDLVRVYYETYNDWWQFKLQDGHWQPINLEVLGGENTVSANNAPSGNTFFAFEVTDEIYQQLTLTGQGWGYSFVINGEGAYITGISKIHFGAAEKRTVIWEGSVTVGNWDGSMGALSWGGYDWSTVEAGTKLAVSFTADSDDAVMRFGNGSWQSLPSLAGLAQDGNLPIAGLTSYEFELTAADLAELVNNGGLVICGAFWTITEVVLVTMEGGGPVEETIWEGSVSAGPWANAMSDLSWGGYDWSTVSAGTILCAHYTIDDPDGCIRFGNGSWVSLPSLAGLATDGNLPLQEGGHEVELTQADLDELVANGGLVICGAGFTITSVGLK